MFSAAFQVGAHVKDFILHRGRIASVRGTRPRRPSIPLGRRERSFWDRWRPHLRVAPRLQFSRGESKGRVQNI